MQSTQESLPEVVSLHRKSKKEDHGKQPCGPKRT